MPGKTARSSSQSSAGVPKLSVALVRDAGNDFRKRQPDGQRRQQENKPGDGSGHADVEQHALGVDRRADANECAERAVNVGAGRKYGRLASTR